MAAVIDTTGRTRTPGRAAWPSRRESDFVGARVVRRLRTSPYLEIRRVACEFHEGMVCLRGRVTSYYLKQIAQTIVLATDGVDAVSNQLEVIAPPVRR